MEGTRKTHRRKETKNIGLNYSKDFALADGIVKNDYEEFMAALPEDYKIRVVFAEKLAIAWIETRTTLGMHLYEELVAITHNIIKEAFSSKTNVFGKTTTDDIAK